MLGIFHLLPFYRNYAAATVAGATAHALVCICGNTDTKRTDDEGELLAQQPPSELLWIGMMPNVTVVCLILPSLS